MNNLSIISIQYLRYSIIAIAFSSILLLNYKGLIIDIFEYKIRSIFFYFLAKDNLPNPPFLLWDLYTSQTYDSSPNQYKFRYNAYRMPETLKLFCDMGMETVIFDLHMDYETWMGKYLKENDLERKNLESSLGCFKKIYIPIDSKLEKIDNLPFREEATNNKIFRIHTESISTMFFNPIKEIHIEKTNIYVPYIGVSLYESISDNKNIINKYKTYPLWFSYHPNSIPRFMFEDVENLFEIQKFLGMEGAKDVVLKSNQIENIPKVLLVGFTNDSLDLHTMPYDLGGGYVLGKGNESFTHQTAGLYAFTSTVVEYIKNGIPYDLKSESPTLFFIFDLVIILLLHEFFGRIKKFKTRSFFLLSMILTFIFITYLGCIFGFTFYSIFQSLRTVFIFIIVTYLLDLERKKLIAVNIINYDNKNENISIQNPYFTSDLNLQYLGFNSKLDAYSGLLAKIDFLESFLHTVSLLTIADYHRRFSKYSLPEIQLDTSKMSLGHYAANLEKIINKCSENDSLNLFLPQLYYLYKNNKKQDFKFKDNIKKLVEIRNQWKHEKSASNTDNKIDEINLEVDSVIKSLTDECQFLSSINLAKPVNFIGNKDDKLLWRVMDYSEIAPVLKLWETKEILEINKLYAINHQKSIDSLDRILLLEPYIKIEDCIYHNRPEYFYYSKIDDKSQKVSYSSLTRSCKF